MPSATSSARAYFTAEDRTSFWHRLLNRDHLMKAHAFFERHGGKAIVLGRFVPIVRTFVPFVAGCGSMSYPQFAFYNVTGGMLWVGLCVGAGYAFGNMPMVKENFELVVVAIVFISLLPIAWGYLISRLQRNAPAIVKAKELYARGMLARRVRHALEHLDAIRIFRIVSTIVAKIQFRFNVRHEAPQLGELHDGPVHGFRTRGFRMIASTSTINCAVRAKTADNMAR